MLQTAQTRVFQNLQKLWENIAALRNPHNNLFPEFSFKYRHFVNGNENWLCETKIVKQARFVFSTVLIKGSVSDAGSTD